MAASLTLDGPVRGVVESRRRVGSAHHTEDWDADRGDARSVRPTRCCSVGIGPYRKHLLGDRNGNSPALSVGWIISSSCCSTWRASRSERERKNPQYYIRGFGIIPPSGLARLGRASPLARPPITSTITTSTTRSAADMRAVRRSADRRRTPARPHLDLFTLQGFCRGATAGRSRPCSTAGDRASSRSAAGAGQEETATPA